jgi:short chain dehydrogenase
LVRTARGRVVFVGSVNGRLSLPFLSPYGASKHAIEAIGDSLRGEMRPFGVKVSIIEPGAIETPMREKGSAAAAQVKAELSADQLRLYGKAIDGFMAAAAKGDEQASRPGKVAAAIEHALTARRPRTRYLVGPDARAQALLRSLLPDRLGDNVIAFLMRGIKPLGRGQLGKELLRGRRLEAALVRAGPLEAHAAAAYSAEPRVDLGPALRGVKVTDPRPDRQLCRRDLRSNPAAVSVRNRAVVFAVPDMDRRADLAEVQAGRPRPDHEVLDDPRRAVATGLQEQLGKQGSEFVIQDPLVCWRLEIVINALAESLGLLPSLREG